MDDTRDMNDRRFEALLQSRYMPEPSSNLSERIIEAARMHRAQGRSGSGLWMRAFWDAFLLPHPAYVMAAVFAIGMFLGLYSDIAGSLDLSDSLTSLIYTAEDVSEGDWL